MRRRPLLFLVIGLIAVAVAVPVAQAVNRPPQATNNSDVAALVALGNEFTYQGRLTDGGGPANAVYDIRFILYDADAGGSQVGPTVEKDNLTVANGLFSTELDFGAAAFDGNARWLEIAIRPGASAGAYTVLSPRQPINPVPYASYAKKAGGIGLPFTGSASSNAAAVDINQAGEGIVIRGDRTYNGTSTAPSIFGTNAGSGAGVLGRTTYDGGAAYGLIGDAAQADSGTGGLFSGPTAIELQGPIKVSGTNPTAFVHVATAGNTSGHITTISNPLTDGDPDAILIVTQHWSPPGGANTYNNSPIGVYYANGTWRIFNENTAVDIDPGAGFNVLVIKR